jgi:hypothetical protein
VDLQNIFEGCARISTFLCGPPISSLKTILELEQGIKSSSDEPIINMKDGKVI